MPTLTFGVLHCFFVIAHHQRRVLHFNVTRHPSSAWISQQLREAFPYDKAPTYLIFDRAANFNEEVVSTPENSFRLVLDRFETPDGLTVPAGLSRRAQNRFCPLRDH